jgi:hypothetical protein
LGALAVLEAPILLVEGFCPLLPVLAGHGILEVPGGAIWINIQIKTVEGTVASTGEVLVLLCCCYIT